MFKGIALLFAVILFAFCFYSLYSSPAPALKGYAKEYELYLSAGSFGDNIVNATDETFSYYKNVKGESCVVTVPYETVIHDFNAKHLFTEQIDDGVIYYAYSPKIKYKAYVNGKAVNLQYYAGKTGNKLGVPLIFGSF